MEVGKKGRIAGRHDIIVLSKSRSLVERRFITKD
jgi:hypothetical protein